MQCDYFDAGMCRSCTRMGEPYPRQVAEKDARVREIVGPRAGLAWEEPFASPESHFRAKAKMIVGGTPEAPTFGILDGDGHGIDLRACGLLGPATTAAMPVLAEFVTAQGLRPYDVPRRTGELKNVHVLESESGELMLRFVLRSEGQVGRIRRGLPALQAALPGLRVVSANLLPQHAALPEGDEEILLTEESTLATAVGDVVLHPMPGAFVQTNTAVAAGLYRQAATWIDETLPDLTHRGDGTPPRILDLYCGIGGFALHAAAPGRDVLGVEVSAPAVASARRSAEEAGLSARFEVGDATAYAESLDEAPDLVVVNPPRRGIGTRLSTWLENSGLRAVVYSSCNPTTLARDLDAMPSLRPVRARLFDMFPQSDHAEVLMLLRRA
ncbi:methyltransferase domain-containing protein [Mobilicoccus pelagius]|uniref:23S rRNA (Uracil-5-)-methyltransferase RumB n=1 Tax=Mobilicoccus pelagius NBRC 104925 TaxID=1089455 RepID=H5UR57_9MICO|nr:methyltransferase domain-containing protein [Mobilicoccus pelagius]GAB48215.1 23S rRNA (uracil-5-)-methyltransferase RumB [Mobilicoccus pelagius NBRC 104925]